MHAFRLHLLCLVIVALAWSAATAADPATPSGAAASWAELRGVRDAIAADVGAGRLGEIHARSERLVPLANALLQGSKDLAPEKRARVESAVKQLPKVAGALHEAADAGNGEATRRQLERLDGLLELIRAQYPPGALPWSTPAGSGHATPTPSGHHHAMHEHVHALAMGAAPGQAHAASAPEHAHGERPVAAVDVAPIATLRVRAGEFAFEPRRMELRAGEATRIELQNDGAIEHALVVYDFLWASRVQAFVASAFRLGGLVFLVEEVLLFSVLVLVKHRLPPPWGRSHAP